MNKKKSDDNNNHLALFSLVAIVAIVGVISLVMMTTSTPKAISSDIDSMYAVDDSSNLAGNAMSLGSGFAANRVSVSNCELDQKACGPELCCKKTQNCVSGSNGNSYRCEY